MSDSRYWYMTARVRKRLLLPSIAGILVLTAVASAQRPTSLRPAFARNLPECKDAVLDVHLSTRALHPGGSLSLASPGYIPRMPPARAQREGEG